MFGTKVSMPNIALPVDFPGTSRRGMALPMYLSCPSFLSVGFCGTGRRDASNTSFPYERALPVFMLRTTPFTAAHSLSGAFSAWDPATTSISRPAAPAFLSASCMWRMLVLPPVDCMPQTGSLNLSPAGANSIRTRFQSASSSSAMIMGIEVATPWPISDLITMTVILSSAAMRK